MTQETAKPRILMHPMLGFIAGRFEDQYQPLLWPKDGLDEYLATEAQGVEVLVTGAIGRLPEGLENLPSLKALLIVGAGYEAIGIEHYWDRGVTVTNTPGANAEDVADHAVALALSVIRELPEGDARMRAGRWMDVRKLVGMRSVRNWKVGIAGFGAIGQYVATRMTAFGCQVSWWGPRAKPDVAYPYVESLKALAEQSDLLVLSMRADASNAGMVDAEILKALGPKGVLINMARGSVVDEDALIAALKEGTIAGAGLDVFQGEPVFDTKWADVPNTVLTPHTAGGGDGSWDNMVAMLRENLRRFYEGEPLTHVVPR